jgi:hypothetical protein
MFRLLCGSVARVRKRVPCPNSILVIICVSACILACFAVVPGPSPGDKRPLEPSNATPNINGTVTSAIRKTVEAYQPPAPNLHPDVNPDRVPTDLSTPSPILSEPSTPTPTRILTPTPLPTAALGSSPASAEAMKSHPHFIFAPLSSLRADAVPYFDSKGFSTNNPEVPVLGLVYLNTSGKVVDGLEFTVCPKDAFGDGVRQEETGWECLQLFYNEEIEPMVIERAPYLPLDNKHEARLLATQIPGTGRIKWPLEGFGGAVQAEVTLDRIHFADDTVWPEAEPTLPKDSR